MNAHIPAWIGWPSKAPAPGHDWLPGPFLRGFILTITYAFFALTLTVNYASSVPFFLLAIIGIYVGLRRGFLNSLKLNEKSILLALSLYPAFIILSYIFGLHTAVGFRVLGREIRFLLTIPVFIAIYWSRPKKRDAGIALIIGAFLAAIFSAIHWSGATTESLLVGTHMPHGAAATHITYGALSLLFGTLGALLVTGNECCTWERYVLALLGITSGISTAFLSLSRTAWLAFPILFVIGTVWLRNKDVKRRYIAAGFGIVFLVIILIFSFQPVLKNRLLTAADSIKRSIVSTSLPMPHGICPNTALTLTRYSKIIGQPEGQRGAVIYVRNVSHTHNLWNHLCPGGSEIVFKAGHQQNVYSFSLPRIGFHNHNQFYAALAKGYGTLWIWWPKKHANISPESYKIVRVTSKSKDPAAKGVLKIPAGKQVTFIPLQFPAAYGGYSLPLYKGSIADRLAMWKFSIQLFLKSPWIGHGAGSFRELGEIYSIDGNAQSLTARRFEHPHSSYFNNLYGGGIVLFIAFLALILSPFLARPSLNTFTITSFMAGFCLTESMFMHSFTITCYVILVAIAIAVNQYKRDF